MAAPRPGFDPDVWAGNKPIVMPKRAIGVVRLVEPGCIVYSKHRRDADDFPLGGIAVEKAGDRYVYDEDGHVVEIDREWLVVDHERTRPTIRHIRLAESEIDRESLSVAMPSQLAGLIRRLCDEVCRNGTKQRRGPMSSRDEQYVRWAHRLSAVLFPGVG